MTTLADRAVRQQVHAEVVRQSGLNGFYFLAAALLLMLIDERIRDHPGAAGTFVVLFAVMAVVRVAYYRNLEIHQSLALGKGYLACLFGNVLAWGCFTAWLMSLDPALGSLAAVAVASSAAAAAVSVMSLAMHRWLGLTASLLLFAPPAIWLIPQVTQDEVAGVLLVMCALYLVVLAHLSRRLHAGYLQTVQATQALEQKTGELEQARNEALAANRALEQARNEALRASSAKSEFLAHMSHDIRTPLNGIIGMADVLTTTGLSRQQRDYVGTIAESGQLVLSLINDILDFSQISAGRIRVVRTRFQMRALAQETLAIMQPLAIQQGNRMELVDELPPQWELTSDRLRLQQILTNLLANAVRFTQQGLIELRLSLVSQGGQTLFQLQVRDTGKGIAEAEQERIFEAFQQVEAQGEQRSGSGLGLAICRKLTEALGGTIGVESRLGAGSCFRVTLPLGEPGDAYQGTTARPAPLLAAQRRVMVVEDNTTNRVVMQVLLEKLGLPHVCVESGEAALAACERQMPDLILMDCNLPGISGLEATRVLREREARLALPRVPIIAVTANAYADDVRDCLASGMDDHLAKPLTLDTLERTLRRWLSLADVPSSPA